MSRNKSKLSGVVKLDLKLSSGLGPTTSLTEEIKAVLPPLAWSSIPFKKYAEVVLPLVPVKATTYKSSCGKRKNAAESNAIAFDTSRTINACIPLPSG